jgi:hypothetical protein
MYKFGARYYNPVLARWTQPDPLTHVADLRQANPYGYAAGDPVNAVDLSGLGLDVFEAIEIAGAGVVTGGACAAVETGIGAAACLGGAAATSGLVGSSLKD